MRSLDDVLAPAGADQARVTLGWTGGGAGTGGQSVFFDDVIFDGAGIPPTGFTWAANRSGDWNARRQLGRGVVPQRVGRDGGFFGGHHRATHGLHRHGPSPSAASTFNNANTYVLAGAGSLTIDVASGSGSIGVHSGSHKINLPLFVNDNTTANVASGATLTIADPLASPPGRR